MVVVWVNYIEFMSYDVDGVLSGVGFSMFCKDIVFEYCIVRSEYFRKVLEL